MNLIIIQLNIRTIFFLILLIFLSSLTIQCSTELEQGDPGGILKLSKCMSTVGSSPINNEFSNPVKVAINGHTTHAMEPFITRNGSYLFFNSLNDGINTSLYYASMGGNDYTFNLAGEINGVNGTPPHLDAVASMDTGGNFYFVSVRNYPSDYMNFFTGNFSNGTVTGLQALPGNFYIESPGWLIMDAEISPDGNDLYYVNAHFNSGPVPELSDIGVAHNSSGSFIVDANSTEIMTNVNTGNHLEYAPSISSDGLELYFTRLNLCLLTSEILVAKRNSVSESFGIPERIGVMSGFVEAPSLSSDGNTLYYHRKDNDLYVIYKVSR